MSELTVLPIGATSTSFPDRKHFWKPEPEVLAREAKGQIADQSASACCTSLAKAGSGWR